VGVRVRRRRPPACECRRHRRAAATPASCRAASRGVGPDSEPGLRGSDDDPQRVPWMTYR
jgi:hypothetical protein